MNEKIIIESEKQKAIKFFVIIGVVFALFFAVAAVVSGIYSMLAAAPIVVLYFAFLGFIFDLIFSKVKITATDKRVYGITFFGKRVDLPLDSISAVGTGIIKKVTVTTSSGRVSFSLIKNADEIHSEISKLLLERQKKTEEPYIMPQTAQMGNADEIKKFKELLDNGIITQEEFDAKKKQLLGL